MAPSFLAELMASTSNNPSRKSSSRILVSSTGVGIGVGSGSCLNSLMGLRDLTSLAKSPQSSLQVDETQKLNDFFNQLKQDHQGSSTSTSSCSSVSSIDIETDKVISIKQLVTGKQHNAVRSAPSNRESLRHNSADTSIQTAQDRTVNPITSILEKHTDSPPTNRNKVLEEMMNKRNEKASNVLRDLLVKREFVDAPSLNDNISAETPRSSEKDAETDKSCCNGTSSLNDEVALQDHPEYASYFKMLRIGHPREVVQHAMQRNGVDPTILDHDPSRPLPRDEEGEAYKLLLSKYNECIGKYTKMLKMGLPRQAVEHKMHLEGVETSWLDAPPQLIRKPKKRSPTPSEIIAHQRKFAAYFSMIKMGIPREAVEHKMRLDAIDPRELDGPFLDKETISKNAVAPTVSTAAMKHNNIIRKKIHWQVKKSETNRRSLWSTCLAQDASEQDIVLSKESQQVLEKVFVKEVTKNQMLVKDKRKISCGFQSRPITYLIDMKKSQNIAIILARIKLNFSQLKSEILALNPTVLSTAQLQSLMDMWPDQIEQEAIDHFHHDVSTLGTAERFLIEIRNIPRFREKLGCLKFKQEFPNRIHELRESMTMMIRSVNQICSSILLRKLFIYILRAGNALNFGIYEQNGIATGFSLGSLVKLSHTKAFTGGLTFLQYIVESIVRDMPELLHFPRQIHLLHKCRQISIVGILGEKRALEDGWRVLHHEAQAILPVGGCVDAELAGSILKHYAAEVGREIEALESQIDQLMCSKMRFLEYFDEQESSEELDVLVSYIADFTMEFEKELAKYKERVAKEKQKSHNDSSSYHLMNAPIRIKEYSGSAA